MNARSGLYRDVANRASSIATDWLTPVVSWVGAWFVDSSVTSNGRSDASRIAESLLSEIVLQGRLIEQIKQEREREAAAARKAVDYSWLVTVKRPQYDVTDAERLDLEQLFRHVAPESYSRVVREFRSALLRDPAPADLPGIMRAIVHRVIDEQNCKTDSTSTSTIGNISSWIGQSMTNLRSRVGGSTMSISVGEDLELSSNVSSMELGSLENTEV